MAPLRKSERFLLVLTIVVVFAVSWVLFVLQPVLDYGRKLDAELVNKNFKLREAKHLLASSAQQTALKDSLKNYFSKGSTQEDMARMIQDIETAAGGAGLKVLEMKPQPQIDNVGWFELWVGFSFEGRWTEIVRFLYELENNEKSLLVKEMLLEADLTSQNMIRGRLGIGRFFIASPL